MKYLGGRAFLGGDEVAYRGGESSLPADSIPSKELQNLVYNVTPMAYEADGYKPGQYRRHAECRVPPR